MNNLGFSTSTNPEELAAEVACLKATVTLLLKAIGQADAGKVILNLDRMTNDIDDPAQAAIAKNTLKQIIQVYRQ